MSLEKKDFYGKEVTDAIKKACDALDVPQEKLEIEVIETGSTGIFGLIRKKAHIRVGVKPDTDEDDPFEVGSILEVQGGQESAEKEQKKDPAPSPAPSKRTKKSKPQKQAEKVVSQSVSKKEFDSENDKGEVVEQAVEEELSPESLEIVKGELLRIVELMGFPSTLELETSGLNVNCTLRGEFEEQLAGPDGKVLDSLQYILRKVVSRQVPERIRIGLNVGDFREKRLEDLKERALNLAEQVKENGKTQALPALNPSERRAIHMVLQEDKQIRSRSVGDGLFKKILIYKPGKSNRAGNKKRSYSKARQGKGSNRKQSQSNET